MNVFAQFQRTAMEKEAIAFQMAPQSVKKRIEHYPSMIAPHKVGFAGRIQPRHRRWDQGEFEPTDYHDEDVYHRHGHVDDDKWHHSYDKYDPVAKDTKEFSHFILHHGDNDDMWKEHAPVQSVDLRKTPITAYQPTLVKHHLLAYMDNPHKNTEHQQKVDRRQRMGEDTTDAQKAVDNYPFTHTPGIVKYQGRHISIEGTHRIGERLLSGAHGMDARVYDADKHGFPANPKGPIPERPRPSWPPHDPNWKPPKTSWDKHPSGLHTPSAFGWDRPADHSALGGKGSYDMFGQDTHHGTAHDMSHVLDKWDDDDLHSSLIHHLTNPDK